MRINEIDNIDKSALALKGIRYNFSENLNIVLSVFHLIGSSSHRRQSLKDDIDVYLEDIEIFLNQGFPDNDLDIIAAKDIYNKLLEIKNKL